ncbi:Vicilin-like seed storage protein At2g28490 [Linum perenne]
MMGYRAGVVWLVLLSLCCHVVIMRTRGAMAMGKVGPPHGAGGLYRQEQEEEEEEWEETGEEMDRRRRKERAEGDDWFLVQDSKQVIKTEAGEMSVARNLGGRSVEKPLHMGFLTMEPRSLLIPQYLDSGLLIFIRRGEAKIGLIYKDELAERRLKIGDLYWISPGSVFYLVNTGEGQRLQVICAIDPSESLGFPTFQSFFIGGGSYPTSVLAGFDDDTLTTAFNVTRGELREMMSGQGGGPIVFVNDSREPEPRRREIRGSIWSEFLELKHKDRLQQLRQMVDFRSKQELESEEEASSVSWRKVFQTLVAQFGFGGDNKRITEWGSSGKSPDSYNLYSKKADFSNAYGWSIALDDSDYSPLKHSGIGVFLVNLTAGSMMAPHVNPTATEYGVVLSGTGSVEIVYPNGTKAMNANIAEGDVFWVPRYFPFCQMASRTGPLEFFGFTTSAHKNRPQFLVGKSSVLETMKGPELAASFGIPDERLRRITGAQRESIILPSAAASPPDVPDDN